MYCRYIFFGSCGAKFCFKINALAQESIWGFHLCIDNLVIKMEGSNSFVLGIRLY